MNNKFSKISAFSGKVEIITGVGKAMPAKLAKWNNPNRPISGSGAHNSLDLNQSFT